MEKDLDFELKNFFTLWSINRILLRAFVTVITQSKLIDSGMIYDREGFLFPSWRGPSEIGRLQTLITLSWHHASKSCLHIQIKTSSH